MSDIVERLRDPEYWWQETLRREAADEIERLKDIAESWRNENYYWEARWRDETKENERLRALVKDLADDLECELNGHYPPEVRAYPSEQRRYERDMANVYEARRALEPKT